MAMTLQELTDEIVDNHGGITGKDTLIKTILNLIVKDLCTNHSWRDLQDLDASQTLSEDSYQITVPSTIQKVEFCNLLDSDDNWYEVDVLPLKDFRNLEDGSGTPVPEETAALPEYAHLLGYVLTFNRKSDKDYTVYLDNYLWPTDMAAVGSYPSITNADPILIAYGTAWLYLHRKQPQTATVWFNMADTFFKSITNEDHGAKFQFTRKQMGI
jgi:hypothetical protein